MAQKVTEENPDGGAKTSGSTPPAADAKNEKASSAGLVFVVDDDRFLADMYSMKFMQKGFTVETHQSVKDALAALRSGVKPSAVLFDVIMPEQDGFEFLKMTKAEKLAEGAVFIALTNQNNDTDRAQSEKLGADQYIVKASMIPSEVVEATIQAIGKKK